MHPAALPILAPPPLPPLSASFVPWRNRKVELFLFPIFGVTHLIVGIIQTFASFTQRTPNADYSVAYGEYCLKPKASQHFARGLVLLIPVIGALFLYFYYDPKKKKEETEIYLQALQDLHFSAQIPIPSTHWQYLEHLCQITEKNLRELQNTHPLDNGSFDQHIKQCKNKQEKVRCFLRIQEALDTPDMHPHYHTRTYDQVYRMHDRLRHASENPFQETFHFWHSIIDQAPTLNHQIEYCCDALRLCLEWYAEREEMPPPQNRGAQFLEGKPDEASKALLQQMKEDVEFQPLFLSLLKKLADSHEKALDEAETFQRWLVHMHKIDCALYYCAQLESPDSFACFERIIALWQTIVELPLDLKNKIFCNHQALETFFNWYALLNQHPLPQLETSFATSIHLQIPEIEELLDEIENVPIYWNHLQLLLAQRGYYFLANAALSPRLEEKGSAYCFALSDLERSGPEDKLDQIAEGLPNPALTEAGLIQFDQIELSAQNLPLIASYVNQWFGTLLHEDVLPPLLCQKLIRWIDTLQQAADIADFPYNEQAQEIIAYFKDYKPELEEALKIQAEA